MLLKIVFATHPTGGSFTKIQTDQYWFRACPFSEKLILPHEDDINVVHVHFLSGPDTREFDDGQLDIQNQSLTSKT